MAKAETLRQDGATHSDGGTRASLDEATKTPVAMPVATAAAAMTTVTETTGSVAEAKAVVGARSPGAAAAASAPGSERAAVAGSEGAAVAGCEGAAVAGSEGAAVACSEGVAVACSEGAAVAGSEGAAVACSERVAVACSEGVAVACSEGAAVAGSEGAAVACSEGGAVAAEGNEGAALGAGGPSVDSNGADPSRHTLCDQGTRRTRCREAARNREFRTNDCRDQNGSEGVESKAEGQQCKGGRGGGVAPKQCAEGASSKAATSSKLPASSKPPANSKAAVLLGRASGPTRVPSVALHECPVFHPSPEEFADPLRFIARVRPVAEPCGMCRIVPPPGWDPPFALDRSKFRFRTKVQALHQLQRRPAPADPATFALDYLRFLSALRLAPPPALQRALARAGMGLGKKGVSAEDRAVVAAEAMRAGAVDICTLFHAVQRRGGFARVSESRAWGDVLRWRLEELEAWRETGGEEAEGEDGCSEARGEAESAADGKRKRQEREADGEKGSKSQKRNDGSSSGQGASDAGRSNSHRRAAKGVKYSEAESDGEEEDGENDDSDSDDAAADAVCERCRGGGHEEQMLLCDRCDRGWHLFCLSPPLSTVPPGTWFCQDCVARPHDTFGFTTGDNISIAALQRADRMLREQLFGAKQAGALTSAQLEEAFWRIVDGAVGPVETLYGSDIDTGVSGSGFPRRGEPVPPHAVQSGVSEARWRQYAEARWNLNNLARDAASVLRYVEDAIPGVIVPWLYMGMSLSAFCWHFEDHCFYSVNYVHWGEPKLWYGVPGHAAEAFEKVMRSAFPDLFSAQPDLLFQLVTMLHPMALHRAGVPIFRTVQAAGEFVITFPRSYHGGFNQGVNCAEAVNFAPCDWLPWGGLSVERYRLFRRKSILSHEEMLCVLLMNKQRGLLPGEREVAGAEVRRIVEGEQRARDAVWAQGTVRSARMAPHARADAITEEEDLECLICRYYLFLSAVVCSCRPRDAVCLQGQHQQRQQWQSEGRVRVLPGCAHHVFSPRQPWWGWRCDGRACHVRAGEHRREAPPLSVVAGLLRKAPVEGRVDVKEEAVEAETEMGHGGNCGGQGGRWRSTGGREGSGDGRAV
ncbi:hypothetical protein CLOP_g15845 [Closterium sp. NIES-67]|nr:hypothetical protein CLOP_g15845 [Closterium sp. NIES-67]